MQPQIFSIFFFFLFLLFHIFSRKADLFILWGPLWPGAPSKIDGLNPLSPALETNLDQQTTDLRIISKFTPYDWSSYGQIPGLDLRLRDDDD